MDRIALGFVAVLAVGLGGCAMETGDSENAAATTEEIAASPSHAVRGNVSGLDAIGLVLENNHTEPIGLVVDGLFVFEKTLEPGASYSVTVAQNPDDETCTVQNGSGIMGDVDAVVGVMCEPNAISLRGTIDGLEGNVLLGNGEDVISVHGDGAFFLPKKLGPNTAFSVEVVGQPTDPAATCVVESGAGVTRTDDVTDIRVTCQPAATAAL